MIGPRRARYGLTVMELIVAAALFAVSILVLMGVFPLSARAVRKAQVRTIATHLAENQLEKSRASSFVSVGNVPPYSVVAEIVNNNVTETIDFSVEQNVTAVSSAVKRVRVTVKWNRESQDQTAYLETDLASTVP